jgi:hypothetical protein
MDSKKPEEVDVIRAVHDALTPEQREQVQEGIARIEAAGSETFDLPVRQTCRCGQFEMPTDAMRIEARGYSVHARDKCKWGDRKDVRDFGVEVNWGTSPYARVVAAFNSLTAIARVQRAMGQPSTAAEVDRCVAVIRDYDADRSLNEPKLKPIENSGREKIVEPVRVGTFVVRVFQVAGYDSDCDGSLMARLESVNKNGQTTGWEPRRIGLDPTTTLVVEHPLDIWPKEQEPT